MVTATFQDPSGTITAQASSMGIPVSDPSVASAIASIQVAAKAEGLDPGSLEVAARVSTLFDSYQGIYSKLGSGVGNAAQTALSAARSYVTQNHELQGAIGSVQGLVGAALASAQGNATPQDVAANFSGPLIALLTTAGVVSAGVGAAIVGGLAIASEMLDTAGVLANKPGVTICPGFQLGTAPQFAINCTAVYDPQGTIAPKSPFWRSFPEPTNKTDAWWFDYNSPRSNSWKNAQWISEPQKALGSSPMDVTIPEWWAAHLTFDSYLTSGVMAGVTIPKGASHEQLQALQDFSAMFFQAWKANKEYWINGHSGAPDWQVLLHTAEIWNRAHQPGQGVDVNPAQMENLAGGPPIAAFGPYWMTLINQLAYQASSDVMASNGKQLHLNTGPIKTVKRVIPLYGIGKAAAAIGHVPIKPQPQPIHPGHLAAGSIPPAVSAVGLQHSPVGPAKPSIWSRVKPWMPFALGVAAYPVTGALLVPVVGAAGTALWIEADRKGWKLPFLSKL